MAFDNHAGANKMARVLSDRMKKEGSSPLVLDFGSIGSDYSLTTNTFPVKIPKGDYAVCRHVSGISAGTSGGSHGGHEFGDGSHSHSVSLPRISPGSRVLVAWVQSEAVVVDVITDS